MLGDSPYFLPRPEQALGPVFKSSLLATFSGLPNVVRDKQVERTRERNRHTLEKIEEEGEIDQDEADRDITIISENPVLRGGRLLIPPTVERDSRNSNNLANQQVLDMDVMLRAFNANVSV